MGTTLPRWNDPRVQLVLASHLFICQKVCQQPADGCVVPPRHPSVSSLHFWVWRLIQILLINQWTTSEFDFFTRVFRRLLIKGPDVYTPHLIFYCLFDPKKLLELLMEMDFIHGEFLQFQRGYLLWEGAYPEGLLRGLWVKCLRLNADNSIPENEDKTTAIIHADNAILVILAICCYISYRNVAPWNFCDTGTWNTILMIQLDNGIPAIQNTTYL